MLWLIRHLSVRIEDVVRFFWLARLCSIWGAVNVFWYSGSLRISSFSLVQALYDDRFRCVVLASLHKVVLVVVRVRLVFASFSSIRL